MASENELARATNPKSLGTRRRTRTTVLTIPSNRLMRRHPISHPAPFAARIPRESVLSGPPNAVLSRLPLAG